MLVYNFLCGNDFNYKKFSILAIFQRRTTVVYLKLNYFERPSLAVLLIEMSVIGSYVRIYINVRGK